MKLNLEKIYQSSSPTPPLCPIPGGNGVGLGGNGIGLEGNGVGLGWNEVGLGGTGLDGGDGVGLEEEWGRTRRERSQIGGGTGSD